MPPTESLKAFFLALIAEDGKLRKSVLTSPPCFNGNKVTLQFLLLAEGPPCPSVMGVIPSPLSMDHTHGPILLRHWHTLLFMKTKILFLPIWFARPSTYTISFSSHNIPVGLSLSFPFKM